jgi:hypothetical protein
MAYWIDRIGALVCLCGACAKREFDWPPDPQPEQAAEGAC